MCGINGFSFSDEKRIKTMNAAIAHRGPDDHGVYVDENISLGHVRLAVVDLTAAGHQPMFYKHKGREVGIVFNGEIYNFQDIRRDLETKGYTFKSQSDTEVILAAYLEYGEACVDHFNGMWAFAIYDRKDGKLFCSRDRLGVKPFYYYHDGTTFIFSSELKGILTHTSLDLNRRESINPRAIDYYYSIGFIPAPETVFTQVSKLEARHNLTFDLKSGTVKTWAYFAIPAYKPEYDKTALLREGRELLEDAVRLRLIADVPVGAFLSGGLDSSSVVGIMSKFIELKNLHTFSIGFEGDLDESPFIEIVKDYYGTKHHHFYFRDKDFPEALDRYKTFFDEPHCDFGFLPSFMVSQKAREAVTAVLTGDGGDEIFAGYGSFANVLQYERIRKIPRPLRSITYRLISLIKKQSDWTVLGKIRELTRWSLVDTLIPLKELYPNHAYFGPASREWYEATMRACIERAGTLTEASRYHSLFYLSMGDNFLTKTDRTTMGFALEARSPFCDYRWIDFAARIPTAWKVNWKGGTKLFMRELIRDVVPQAVLTRRKQGFTPPFYRYVEKHADTIRAYVLETLDLTLVPQQIRERLKQESPRDRFFLDTLLRSYLLALWYETWVKQPKKSK